MVMTVDEVNRWIRYHGDISKVMTAERTSLESQLMPVSAYILLACVESYRRWPDMIERIEKRTPVEDVVAGAAGPGSQINPVYLWSLANFFLLGRQILTAFGQIPPDEGVDRIGAVLDFWRRAALAYRGDGHTQAWDAGFRITPPSYTGGPIETLLEAAVPADDDLRRRVRSLSATLYQYLFLLYLDTRVGTGDTGPYEGPGGATVIVRDFYRLGRSDFWWSEVCGDQPYQNLTAALVLRDVDVKVNDWGTSITEPEDYLDRLEAFALFTSDGGTLRPVPLDDLESIVAGARRAQSAHYRQIHAWSIREKLVAGAYVYFTFLKPFADAAGVDLDWTVPRAAEDLMPVLEVYQPGQNPPPDPDAPWYLPIPG